MSSLSPQALFREGNIWCLSMSPLFQFTWWPPLLSTSVTMAWVCSLGSSDTLMYTHAFSLTIYTMIPQCVYGKKKSRVIKMGMQISLKLYKWLILVRLGRNSEAILFFNCLKIFYMFFHSLRTSFYSNQQYMEAVHTHTHSHIFWTVDILTYWDNIWCSFDLPLLGYMWWTHFHETISHLCFFFWQRSVSLHMSIYCLDDLFLWCLKILALCVV